MDLLVATLSGVVVGAVVATAAMLALLRRRADRDLVERRLRACAEYRDCLGHIARILDHQGEQPGVLEQAWSNVSQFCREYHLTSWCLEAPVRQRLGEVVDELELEERKYQQSPNGASGRAAQLLCEKYNEVDRILRREFERQLREYRQFRWWSSGKSGGDVDEDDLAA